MSEQITPTTKAYNSRDHLVTIPTRNGPKEYYPAAWRLYELNIRYEEANFSSEILFMDLERNFVIVKCKLYISAELGNGSGYDINGVNELFDGQRNFYVINS